MRPLRRGRPRTCRAGSPAARRALTVALGAAVLGLPPVLIATPASAKDCSVTSVGFTPLTDGAPGELYQGEPVSLYPGGAHAAPAEHADRGRAAGDGMVPLNAAGEPDPNGRMVFLGVGGSNMAQEFARFIEDVGGTINPDVVLVNAGFGGRDLLDWAGSGRNTDTWSRTESQLALKGVTSNQVTAIWMQNSIGRHHNADFAAWVSANASAMRTIVNEEFPNRFPNLRQVFLSSRAYGGYVDNASATREPYAYETAFAVNRLVADSIADPSGPFVDWGPYLWTDGIAGRNDGFTWLCEDASGVGTHASELGEAKISDLTDGFLRSSPLTTWYRSGVPTGMDVTSVAPSAMGRLASNREVIVTGAGFEPGAKVGLGRGVKVATVTFLDSTSLLVRIKAITDTAKLGVHIATVTNPDGRDATCACFTVNPGPKVLSVSPSSRPAGAANQTITLSGTGFVPGAVVSFGNGTTVHSATVVSDTSIEAVMSVAASANIGSRTVVVTNPDFGVGKCLCFSVVAPQG